MESFCGETEESSDNISGSKKTRLKSLRSRLFGRSKRATEVEKAKLSQSESDITAGKGLGSEEDLACSQGTMGSRALSHDSIFLAEQVLTDVEPSRILSQENVHGKIKALQLKLQQQKWHFGPPPLVLPIKRSEDLESDCQDDSLAHSPPTDSGIEITTSPTFVKTFQPLPLPFSPTPKLPLVKSVSPPPSHPPCFSVTSKSTTSEPPLDFSSPAEFTPSLDTSAARHRASIKPRNQRASTKKRAHTGESASLPTRNNTEHPQHPESVQEEDVVTPESLMFDVDQKEADQPVTSQFVSAQFPDAPESPSKSSWSLTRQDQALLEGFSSILRPVLRVKPHHPGDNADTRRPHSSFIPSELKNKREETFEAPAMMCDKKNTLKKAGAAESSSEHPSEVTPSTRGIKRLSPGSGSFHFSITTARNRDVERPRSGSFAGVLEQARCRTEGSSCLSLKEKPELKDLKQRGSHFPGGAQHKSSALPCNKGDSQKMMEPASSVQSVTTETAAAEVEEAECSQKMVKESVEAQETEKDEVKTAFGIKLRSTSQSMRLRSNYTAKPAALTDEQRDDPESHTTEVSESASYLSWKSTTSKDNQVSDPAPSVSPTKNNLPLTCNPHITPTDLHMTSSNLKEAESSPPEPRPTPQTAPFEVSWVSLAMEKTRSIQQLFAGKFPRDLTGGQARPHSHLHVTNQAEALAGEQLQTSLTLKEAANQPSMKEGKAETQQTRSPAKTVKPKTSSALQSCTSAEQQTDKCHSQLKSAQATSQPTSAWAHPHTTQSPMSSVQTETSLQSAQARVAQTLAQFYLSSAQQQQQPSPMWSDRGQAANKCTTSAPSTVSVSAPGTDSPLVSASVRGEREECMQEKENASVTGRRAIWSGSVSMKAAFLEKQAHWTTLSGTKGMDIKKASAEGQMSEESMASTRITLLSKDSEEGQGLKPAESSLIKVPERSCEDKCLRKNVLSSPSNTPSPAVPLAFQSSSDSSQPSWMELAKRKSMAWSDKSMD